MLQGLIGRKVGMTQLFSDEGDIIPVTAIEAGPCWIVQKKLEARDGYTAVQLGFGPKKSETCNQAVARTLSAQWGQSYAMAARVSR